MQALWAVNHCLADLSVWGLAMLCWNPGTLQSPSWWSFAPVLHLPKKSWPVSFNKSLPVGTETFFPTNS